MRREAFFFTQNMPEKDQSKKNRRCDLARRLDPKGKYDPGQVEKVLSMYPDPDNSEMSLTGFVHVLERAAINGRKLTTNDQLLLDGLNSVLDDISTARLFNATYIGHMLTEASVPGLVGFIMALKTGSNTVSREVSIAESNLEPEAIKGLASIIGYDPEKADGTFTSGGSMAMQTALMAARRKAVAEGKTPTSDHPLLVLGSSYTHYSVRKMCDIVGGPTGLVSKRDVASKDFKMDPDDLRKQLEAAKQNGDPVMAVISIAGETETGKIDNSKEIIDVADDFGVPVIVDGAYGAPMCLSRNRRLFVGMERSFATTIDGHKALGTPYSNGAVIFRSGEDKYLGYGDRAEYLGDDANLGQKRIEGSMGAGPILSTVAVLRTLGTDGLATLYNLNLDRTEHLWEVVEKSPVLTNLYYPELNLLCFGISPEVVARLGITSGKQLKDFIDKTRKELDNGIQGNGGHFFSAAELPLEDGTILPVFRACIMNPRTTDETIDEAICGLERIINSRI